MQGPGSETPALAARIREEPYLFGFFQLVHLLETWQGRPVRAGHGGPMRAEALRFAPEASLAFASSDVRRVHEPGERDRTDDRGRAVEPGWAFRVIVSFLGLYGVASPTPVYLTEMLTATDVDPYELADFLDLFNHRTISLYYRAWQKYRHPYRYEPGGKDELSGYLLSFIGLGDPAVRQRTGVPTSRLLRYLGLLALPTRPPVGLELAASDRFGSLPARVEERLFRWVPIPPEARNAIGRKNSTLGRDLSVGERVPDRAGKFRLALGPLTWKEYLSLLPDQKDFADLERLTALWAGDRFAYDFELVLKKEEVPELELSSNSPPRLGWTSWVPSAPGVAVDPRVVFRPRNA